MKQSGIFDVVVYTRDWHPANHVSFAANNPGQPLFSVKRLEDTGVDQVMWPIHCVQASTGAEFHEQLLVDESDIIVNKGQLERVDSYSGFGKLPEVTSLKSVLEREKVERDFVVGLAYDYCVGETALDAAALGFETYVIKDATKSVASSSELSMTRALSHAGVKLVASSELLREDSQIQWMSITLSRQEQEEPDEDERCLFAGEGAPGMEDDPYDHIQVSQSIDAENCHPCNW